MAAAMERRATAWGTDIRRAWRTASARAGKWSGDLERHLTGSTDRFDLELRERAWLRDRDNDGSLLGR